MNVITGPSYHIQSDWDEVLKKVSGEVWVSRDRPNASLRGRIFRVNAVGDENNPSLSASPSFRVNLLTHNAVEVGTADSEYVTIFVAPRGVHRSVHRRSIMSLDISQDGIAVSVSAENECEAVTWLVKNEHKLKVFREHCGPIYRCRWFPSGQVILSCGADMCLKIWSSDSGHCPVTLCGHAYAVTDVAIVDKGRNIISVSRDGLCKLWNCGEARCIDNIATLSSINCCSLSAITSEFELATGDNTDDGEIGTENKIILLGCEDGQLCCVAVKSRKLLFDLNVGSAVNCCCAIKPTLFAIGCQDGSVSLVEATPDAENRILVTWRETKSPALCALAYGEKGFLIGHQDGSCVYRSVNYLNYPLRLCLTGPSDDPIYDMCCDSRFVYTACRDGAVRKYAPDSYIARHFDRQTSNGESYKR